MLAGLGLHGHDVEGVVQQRMEQRWVGRVGQRVPEPCRDFRAKRVNECPSCVGLSVLRVYIISSKR